MVYNGILKLINITKNVHLIDPFIHSLLRRMNCNITDYILNSFLHKFDLAYVLAFLG